MEQSITDIAAHFTMDLVDFVHHNSFFNVSCIQLSQHSEVALPIMKTAVIVAISDKILLCT